MSSFYQEVSSKICESNGYRNACDELFKKYVYGMIGEEYELDGEVVKKLATSIQCFFLSESGKYTEEGAILLSMLLNEYGQKFPELIVIANNLYTQSGDFPNVKLLKERFQYQNYRYSIFDETQNELREQLNSVDEIDHPLTDYQRSLWEDLASDEDVITSAPTSTGKTHIILRHLVLRLIKSDGAFAVVVVPTRALISEIAKKIYEIAKSNQYEKKVEICTVPKEGPFEDRTFFVMTQERLFEILQAGDLYFDYLFVDEAHNISDKNRGVLLHLTLQKMLEGSNPQIIISMPSQQYQNAFDSVFDGVRFEKQITEHTPVAKIIMPVELKGRKIQITRINNNNSVSINKGFTGRKLSSNVYRLGKNESNIVYQNKTNYCENVALEIAELIDGEKELQSLDDAADYVERFLHPDFSLAYCLRKGVAFHYGPLPGVIRGLVEDLARNEEIDFVVCTSTLAEGVNLPAKNLFLKNPIYQPPYKEAERLETVKLDNITGRAGRMLEHFAGNIFIVEPKDWKFQDYFDEEEKQAEKIPTYFKVLNEDLKSVLEALKGEYDYNNENQYSYYTIANKLLKEYDGDDLSATLKAKELSLTKKQIKMLETHIQDAYNNLKVDTFTLEANPTVGFIQQNTLYEFLAKQADLTGWVLPHPKSNALYPTLESICIALNESGIFLPQEASSVSYSCVIAKKWITGQSLKSIIVQQIQNDSEFGKEYNCNRSVRDVIKVINNDIRFRMSSALRCYHSIITDVIGSAGQDLQSVKIYTFIEVGGCEERMINLANFGLSRETALEIDSVLPREITIDSVEKLRELYNLNKLDQLHNITRKEINNLLF
jgi:hypothetical protein